MRRTLTLEDDVDSLIERTLKTQKISFKALINHALRIGLSYSAPKKQKSLYKTPTRDAGKVFVGDISNIGEILSMEDERCI